jgi:hypothetical protein
MSPSFASLALAASPFDFLFHTWSFQFLGRDIFAHDNWEQIMYFSRIVVALTVAGLLMIEARAKKFGERLSVKTTRRITIGVGVLGFIMYFDGFNPNVRYPDYYHRHEFYHYYLGSKYSHALGYTRLYECTMIAEVENGRGEQIKKRELRDLSVNLIRPVTETYVFKDPAQCKKRFTP